MTDQTVKSARERIVLVYTARNGGLKEISAATDLPIEEK